jgi:hypothetical protein
VTEGDKARGHSATDPRLTRAVVDVLATLERHYPELRGLPDNRVMALQVKLEDAVRSTFDIQVAERGEQRHGGRR